MRMKRILSLLLIALLVCPAGGFAARNPVIGANEKVASGTVTQANMKISAVDGTAFIDFTAANVLTTKIGNLLNVCSVTSGTCIQGFIKAAGTGETLDATNLVTSWTNTNYDVFTSVASPDIVSAIYSTSGTQTAASNTMTTVAGRLYKLVATWTNVAGQAPTLTGTGGFKTTTLAGGANNIYFTATGTSVVLTSTNTAAASWGCTFVLKQITTPSTTGCTIVSTKGGSTFNFANKNATMNYGDAAGYVYDIYKVKSWPIVASGDVDWLDFVPDLTATNAFVNLNGVNLTAYQDGRHLITVCSKTDNKCASGWISAVAPAGETLDVNIVLDGGFSDTANWIEQSGWQVTGGVLVGTNVINASAAYQSLSGVIGLVYKSQFTVVMSGGSVRSSLGSAKGNYYTTSGTYSNYIATSSTSITPSIEGTSSFNGTVDDYSIKRLLDPPSTGARIVSTKGGATRAWFNNTGLTVNSSGDYSYSIIYIGD